MGYQAITSFQNSKIKLANKLITKRQREQEGLFLIDDARDLDRALACAYQVEFAFYCEELASSEDKRLVERLDPSQIYALSRDLMEKASYRQNPGGLVAILQQKAPLEIAALQSVNGHILALVGLEKPGNIGALLRTADAAGIKTIFLVDCSLDIYNPNLIRSSTGASFLGNIYPLTSPQALDYFHQQQMAIVAAHLDGKISLYEWDFNKRPCAIVLGTEDIGLDELWVKNCDGLVKIPMMGQLSDSLNVSVSGAIFMYEALRQQHA